jgi:uridine phosphorylase
MKKILLLVSLIILACCKGKEEHSLGNPFQEYLSTDKTATLLDPYTLVQNLKRTRFKNHELDSLPIFSMILHDSQIEEYLSFLNINKSEVKEFKLGQVNRNIIYVVDSKNLGVKFIINPGLPGGGGISTQAAILSALGIKYIVHIGTCGLFGKGINDSSLIISQGAYSDGAAMLLDKSNSWPRKTLIYSDSAFSKLIFNTAVKRNIDTQVSYGLTIPIFFFQPLGLIKYCLNESNFEKNESPKYVEMEGAPVFAIGKLMNTSVASIVAGTDRYIFENGEVKHSFVSYDADNAKKSAVMLSIEVFKILKAKN